MYSAIYYCITGDQTLENCPTIERNENTHEQIVFVK